MSRKGMVPVSSPEVVSCNVYRWAQSSLFAAWSECKMFACERLKWWLNSDIVTHFSEEPSRHVSQPIVANRRESTTGVD